MSDLISRSELIKKLQEKADEHREVGFMNERFGFSNIADKQYAKQIAFLDAISIVNELAEEYKNTNIITDFLQYTRDNADNYDTNEGWSLADLIDLSIKYSEEYINTSNDTSTTNADRIRSMTDEELAEFFYNTYHYFENGENIVRFNRTEIHDNETDILDWLQSEVEGVTENE